MTKCDRDCDHNSQGYCTKLEECQINDEVLNEAYTLLTELQRYCDLTDDQNKRTIELMNRISLLL